MPPLYPLALAMVSGIIGSAMSAVAAIAAAVAAYLAVLRVRRNRRARRRPSAAMLDAERMIRGLAYLPGRAGVATPRVWPDMPCENELCPYHWPCTVTRRPICFNADCPLDGHPMSEALPS